MKAMEYALWDTKEEAAGKFLGMYTMRDIQELTGYKAGSLYEIAKHQETFYGRYMITDSEEVRPRPSDKIKGKTAYVYALCEHGRTVDRGTAEELAARYGTTVPTIRRMSHMNQRFRGRYQVYRVGDLNHCDYKNLESAGISTWPKIPENYTSWKQRHPGVETGKHLTYGRDKAL